MEEWLLIQLRREVLAERGEIINTITYRAVGINAGVTPTEIYKTFCTYLLFNQNNTTINHCYIIIMKLSTIMK